MKLEDTLDQLHRTVTANRVLQLFTAFNRILLGVGFIYPSIPKIMYRPFTMLPDSNPVGHYFNALYQTGFYYQFIGWSQLVAAVLLLFPRTSHLGALMFFPIILNITVLTNSVGFEGTWLMTILMSLSSLYLVCWDYDRWKTILFDRGTRLAGVFRYEFLILPAIFAVGGMAAYMLFALLGIGNLSYRQIGFPLAFALTGMIFGLLVALHHRNMRIGKLE